MNNEKVLNTRISKELYEEISKRAKKHRVSVSNLIRNLVEDAIELHEDFHDTVDRKVKTFLDSEEQNESALLYYQRLELAVTAKCTNCNKDLYAGDVAWAPVSNVVAKVSALICTKCKDEILKKAKGDKNADTNSN